MEESKSSVDNVTNKVSETINKQVNIIIRLIEMLDGPKGIYIATILVMTLFLFFMFYTKLQGYFNRTYNFYDRMYVWANPGF